MIVLDKKILENINLTDERLAELEHVKNALNEFQKNIEPQEDISAQMSINNYIRAIERTNELYDSITRIPDIAENTENLESIVEQQKIQIDSNKNQLVRLEQSNAIQNKLIEHLEKEAASAKFNFKISITISLLSVGVSVIGVAVAVILGKS